MQSVNVNGVDLEYEVRGAGEPVLLIDMLIADCFVPLLAEPALADRYQLIRYHKRGWVGSTHTPPPVSIADHAADATALLEQATRPAPRSQPNWPSSTPRRCTRSLCWSRRCCRCLSAMRS